MRRSWTTPRLILAELCALIAVLSLSGRVRWVANGYEVGTAVVQPPGQVATAGAHEAVELAAVVDGCRRGTQVSERRGHARRGRPAAVAPRGACRRLAPESRSGGRMLGLRVWSR